MAQIIPAADLEVGDVYRSRGSLRTLEADAYVVKAIRTVRSVETYQVIEAENIRTGLAASINLFRDVEVARLEEQQLRDLKGYLDVMEDGAQVAIVRYAGRFWC
ncbi:hypothetical protein PBI_INDLOVU_83 [Mycobacterium phage Indlovu]|nr:hypothetical protein PBI_INDLOVU_83 [Mycobacterium phage Indlovu]